MKIHMPYDQALKIATDLVNDLAGCCERIEIAGSIRRKKEVIGDIELVAIPKCVPVGWIDSTITKSLLEERLLLNYRVVKGANKYKQIMVGAIAVDIYSTTPEQWGITYCLRTGSADFSKYMVTRRNQGGALPSFLRVHEGRLYSTVYEAEPYCQTPEELDFFRVCGMDFVDPMKRVEGFWKR